MITFPAASTRMASFGGDIRARGPAARIRPLSITRNESLIGGPPAPSINFAPTITVGAACARRIRSDAQARSLRYRMASDSNKAVRNSRFLVSLNPDGEFEDRGSGRRRRRLLFR